MSRYLGPRLRITRRLGHLSGLTRKKPTFKPVNPVNPFGPKKIIPPGQHGRNKSFKKKPYESCEYDYLIRLKLKQRLRYHYGLTEKQLLRYVQKARKIKGSTGRVLLRLLEMRLDNIVFRLHMAPTIKAARQLINHGHILVNKKKVTIPSYQCEPKDIITVAPKIISMELVSRFLNEFDREKSRYERLLKILEFGRKGTTMSLKTQKSALTTKKSIVNKTQKLNNIKSLKIGSILNVKINNKGRNEAEAISYAFGKMIVIHPYFVGPKSLNKNISVIIYKKSKNNKILYTYPADSFYLHLDNLRKLNTLDIAKVFNNSTNKISMVKKQGTSSRSRKMKSSRSALIVMNGAKLLGSARSSIAQRKTRVSQPKTSGQETLGEKTSLRAVPTVGVLVRIIAAKCLNKKAKQKLLNISNLKTLSPSFSKDPVAYREKYVYTKTSRALRLFGTRFYAKILKTRKDKNSPMDRRRSGPTSFGANAKTKTTVNNTKANLQNSQKFVKLTGTNPNAVPFTFKSQQSNIEKISNILVNTTNFEYNSNLENYQNLGKAQLSGVPVFVNSYKTSISKVETLGALKPNLTAKILNNFLYESKNHSLNLRSFQDFIFIVFSKFNQALTKNNKNNKTFKTETILSISKNLNSFFKTSTFQTNPIQSTKFTLELLLISLKLKQLTKVIQQANQNNNTIGEIDFSVLNNTIQKNISLSLMLDKIKNSVENTVKFANSFFSTDVFVPSITTYFNFMFSFIFKAETIIRDILVNSLNTLKSLVMLSKIKNLNKNINNTVVHQFIHNTAKKTNHLYKKLINFSMGSIQKAGLLESLDSNLLYADVTSPQSESYSTYVQQKTNLLEKYSLYSSKNQNIEMVKTLNFLMKYNLLSNSSTEANQSVNHKMDTVQVLLAYFKQQNLDRAKFNYLNSKLLQQQDLSNQIEQKMWFEQLSQIFEQKISRQKLNRQLMLCENLQFNFMFASLNSKLNLLSRYDKLVNKVNKLKNSNLIRPTNYNVLKDLLNSSFNTLQILQSFGSTIYFEKSTLLNSIVYKTVNKISEVLATNSSVFKVLYLHKQNKLKGTLTIDSFNQNVLKVISFAKTNFVKELLLDISQKTELTGFFNPLTDNTTKHFTFISKLHVIPCLYQLHKLNLLDGNIFTQLVSETSEKLAIKQLTQTNIVLSRYLENNTKLGNGSGVLHLDTFSGTAVQQQFKVLPKEILYNWKKLSVSVTPNFLQKGLANLQKLNIISGDKYSYLLVKLQNLHTQYKTLGLQGNNKYLTEKFVILKTLLSLVSRNLTSSAFANWQKSGIFVPGGSNNWATKLLLNLGLQKQKQIKTSGIILNKEKTNYVLNVQKLENSSERNHLCSFINTYIQSQYKALYRKVLITPTMETTLNVELEKTKVLNSLKLYLLRYKFIVENQQLISAANLVDKKMNLESLIQSKDFIVLYLRKELKAKLSSKLDLQSRSNLLTNTQIQQFENTFNLLTSPAAGVNLSLNLLSNLQLGNPTMSAGFDNLSYLTQQILELSKKSNLSLSYTVLYDNSLVLGTHLDKFYFFDVLQKLKMELNTTKLKVLLTNSNEQAEMGWETSLFAGSSESSGDVPLNLKLHSVLYKTLTNLCLVEKSASLNKDFLLNTDNLITTKQGFLTEFNQTLSYVIYINNLNLLKNTEILSEQTFEQFKNNYETILKLVKKEYILINELNKRKKWKFINYATYQTLVKNSSENLTTKILSLLQRTEKLSVQQMENVPGGSINSISTSSSSLQELIQQTLEQLVSVSESTPSNVTSFIYGFVQKNSLMNNLTSSEKSQQNYGSVNSINIFKDSNKQIIQHTLQSLVSITKKFEALGRSKEKTLLQKKQKLISLQTLISNFHQQDYSALATRSTLFTISNKYKQIGLMEYFSLTNRKNELKPVENQFVSSIYPSLSKQAKHSLLSQLQNVQSKVKKEYGNKLTTNLLSLQNQNPALDSLTIYKESIFGLLQKTTLLESYAKENVSIDESVSKFQTTQFLQNILMHKLVSSSSQLNSMKLDSADVFTYIFAVMPFKHTSSEFHSFISNENLQKLVSSGVLSSTMAKMIQKKLQLQLKKQNFRKLDTLLKTLQKLNYTSLTKFNKVVYYTTLIELFSCLFELKQAKAITERKYAAIKQKLKVFSVFSNLNYKLLAVNETDSVKTELKKQLLQKLLQKLKQSKTVNQFKQSLKSVSSLRKDLASVAKLKNQRTKFAKNQTQFWVPQILFKLLKSRGRWAKVSIQQLATQKLITTNQQEKLNTIIDNQNLIKMKKLRHLIMVFDYCRNILQTQPNSIYNNTNTQLLQEVITSVLKSFNGPWRSVLINLLYKNNFISKDLVFKYLTTPENLNNSTRSSLVAINTIEKNSVKTKLQRLLGIYSRQLKSLRIAQKNRTIIKSEFEQKLSSILSSVLVILEKGGFTAFKILYNSKWVNQLVKSAENNKSTNRSSGSSSIRNFVASYNLITEKYLLTYKKYMLGEKMQLFKVYKNNLLQELVTLEQKLQNVSTNETKRLLTNTRLDQFKAQGLISLKTYKKLKSTLNIFNQRLVKLDKLFALQNLYSLTDNYKLSIMNANSDYTYESGSARPQVQFESNIKKTREQYLKLTHKIILSYMKSEYKQIEKTLIKQKLLLQRLEKSKLRQKRTKNYRNFKNSKLSSSQQFNNFFKQLLNFLDSRYKSGGRNRRNPRINTIIRRLNQQLSFDKTLTQKFGDQLQTFIDKRFGPALPLPPHLELKRWKIKTSKLQSKQKSNLKYFILPVGIVRDLAPRRSVGLPILERLIIEYYSRN